MARAGIAAGSELERELDAWARGSGPKPVAAERALRRELDEAGLLERPSTTLTSRSQLVHVEWTDADTGEPLETLGTAREGDE